MATLRLSLEGQQPSEIDGKENEKIYTPLPKKKADHALATRLLKQPTSKRVQTKTTSTKTYFFESTRSIFESADGDAIEYKFLSRKDFLAFVEIEKEKRKQPGASLYMYKITHTETKLATKSKSLLAVLPEPVILVAVKRVPAMPAAESPQEQLDHKLIRLSLGEQERAAIDGEKLVCASSGASGANTSLEECDRRSALKLQEDEDKLAAHEQGQDVAVGGVASTSKTSVTEAFN